MTTSTFGQFLRDARVRRGKSQKQIARDMGGVAQATVSAWEREKQLPPPTKLSMIAEAYRVDLTQLQGLLAEAETPRPPANWQFTEKCFLKAQRQYIDQTSGHIDVWMLGFGILELLGLSAMRDSWRDNLREGMNYHVVWIFDVMFPAEHCHYPSSRDRYLYFLGVMERIGEIVRGNEDSLVGQVYHYPVVLNMADCDTSMVRRYNEWKGDDIPGNVFYDIRELPFSSVIPIMGCCSDESVTILYVPPTILSLPLAVRMSKVAGPPYSPTPASQIEHLFTFPDVDQAIRLRIAISDFQKLFRS